MKISSYIVRILTGAALVITPAVALSQSSSTSSSSGMSASSTASASSVPATDKKFIREAAEGGMAEVELGRLATEKASNEDVKKFGERMVNDHSKANDELKQIASSKGVDLPNDLSAKDKMLKERLSKLSGDSFDKAYMQNMVKDHRKDVAEFTKESRSASDPEVKQFAGKTLPTLKEHLQKAESIAPSAKTTASSSTSQ
jgi:putative membrane protein